MEFSQSATKFIDASTSMLFHDEQSHCFNNYEQAKTHAIRLYMAAYLIDGHTIDTNGHMHIPGAYREGDDFIMNKRHDSSS